MQPNLVVMLTQLFDHDLGFGPIPEPLHRQAFIPELAIEIFHYTPQPKGVSFTFLSPPILAQPHSNRQLLAANNLRANQRVIGAFRPE
jgi:hypothetical protein